ncbi:MAG: photosynthetic complex assembly protein PuhC [Pseudomonadota bacterium]
MTDLNHTTLGAEQQKLAKRDREMIPLVLVRAMFGLAIVSVALVAFARFTDRPLVGVPDVPEVAAERVVYFAPGAERGTYILTDTDGTVIEHGPEMRTGFIGAMGQVIDRRRKVTGTDPSAPVSIIRRVTGRVDIVDEASGLTVELIGYGEDNVAAFAALVAE